MVDEFDDSDERSGDDADERSGDDAENWPVELCGITESIVTTLGPNDRWNVAALGLVDGTPVTARTWGRTRTWRNFRDRGGGYVQFSRDPVDFVDAASSVREADDPILESTDAWARVEAMEIDDGVEDGTDWVQWALRPVESAVLRRSVPTTNRGYNAVVEATVAASRMGVTGFDDAELRARLAYCERLVDRCGGPREREAFERLRGHVDDLE